MQHVQKKNKIEVSDLCFQIMHGMEIPVAGSFMIKINMVLQNVITRFMAFVITVGNLPLKNSKIK